MPKLRSGDGTLSSRLSAWRATGNVPDADREELRALCPVDGGTPDSDVAISAALIGDPALYRRLLPAGQPSLARPQSSIRRNGSARQEVPGQYGHVHLVSSYNVSDILRIPPRNP